MLDVQAGLGYGPSRSEFETRVGIVMGLGLVEGLEVAIGSGPRSELRFLRLG